MQTLFNFALKRSPQVLRGDVRAELFIEVSPAVAAASHYLSALSIDDFHSVRAQLTDIGHSFGDRRTMRQIRDEFAGHIAVFERARRTDDSTRIADLAALAAGANAPILTQQDLLRLWDNLIHAIFLARSRLEADAIIAAMVGDHVASTVRSLAPTADEVATMRRLKRVAQARVVIPIPVQNLRPAAGRPVLSEGERALLEEAHARFVERYEAGVLHVAANVFASRAAEREAEAEQERERVKETHLAQLEEIATTLDDAARSRCLQSLRTAVAGGNAAAIAASDVLAGLAPVERRLMERFSAGHTAAQATALAKAAAARPSMSAAGNVATSRIHELYAFGTDFSVEESIPEGAAILSGVRDPGGHITPYLTYFHGQRAPLIRTVEVNDPAVASGSTSAHPLESLNSDFQTFRLAEPLEPTTTFELRLEVRPVEASGIGPIVVPPLVMTPYMPHFFTFEFAVGDLETLEPEPVFGVNALGIIDFRRVEQELSCYKMDEVSHIENIMASQYKEKVARSLSILETEDEVTSEFSSERTSDTESTTKNEMQAEVSSVLSEEMERTFNFSAGVSGNFPGGSVTTSVGLGGNSSTSREDSTREALTLAESVTRRVQEKIIEKSTKRRRALSRREHEVTSKHGFDNRAGEEHVVGVYRWVDKEMKNRLVNYGRRSVLEFELPEPARNFIKAQEFAAKQKPFKGKPPETLNDAGLKKPEDINRENYLEFAAKYGVVPDRPPPETVHVSYAFETPPGETGGEVGGDGRTGTDIQSAAAHNEIAIPQGYVAEKVWFKCAPGDDTILVSVAGTVFVNGPSDRELEPVSGTISVAIVAWSLEYAVSLLFACRLSDEAYREWQLATYHIIREGYLDARQVWEEQRDAHKAEARDADLNPKFKSDLMQTELRRLCIEMLARPFGLELAADHYIAGGKKEFDTLDQSPKLERHVMMARFFEETIDWQLAAWQFYPYYYGPRPQYRTRVGMETTKKGLFEAFLTSGLARYLVPIKRGYEDAVAFYMETGEPWFGGGVVLDVKDDLYLSMVEELIDGEEAVTVEKTWTTRLPTDLTILQDRAAAAIADGLPCANTDDDNRLAVGDSRLSPALPPVEPANRDPN